MYTRRVTRLNRSMYINIPVAIAKELRMKIGDTVMVEKVNESIVIKNLVKKPQFVEKRKGHRDYSEQVGKEL